MKKYLFFCLFTLPFFANAQITYFEWNGAGDGLNWESNNNWVGGVAPLNSRSLRTQFSKPSVRRT
jgi:hypothetical protein